MEKSAAGMVQFRLGSFRIDSSMHYSLMARSYGSQFRVILLYRELKFAVVGSAEAIPLAF